MQLVMDAQMMAMMAPVGFLTLSSVKEKFTSGKQALINKTKINCTIKELFFSKSSRHM